MTRAECVTAIRAATLHENDVQLTDAQIIAWIDQEYKQLRRSIEGVAPSLYTATASSQVLSGSSDTITLAADFERLVRLERQVGTDWFPVEASDELTPHMGDLNMREEGATFKLAPVVLAPGTYRVVYVQKVSALTGDSDVILVPDGCEDIIVERIAGRVRARFEESPKPHIDRADACWNEQRRLLKRRYGRHAVPGLRQVRRW